MLLAALIVGVLTGYWYGLRPGAWAAAVTFGLLLLATMVPALSTPIHALLAAGVLIVCFVGPRRERPADAVRATRWVRATVSRVMTLVRSGYLNGTATRKRPPTQNDRRDQN